MLKYDPPPPPPPLPQILNIFWFDNNILMIEFYEDIFLSFNFS